MNIHSKLLAASFAVSMSGLLFSSCVDDNYDLDNIDTTVRVPVSDLVIPVNIEQVTLGSLIDIKEGDRFQIINGQYCVTDCGDYHSSPIEINTIHLGAPSINPTSSVIRLKNAQSSTAAPRDIPTSVEYSLHSESTRFSYTGAGNEYVTAVDSIYGDISIDVNISIHGLENIVNAIELHNLMIQLPKGLNLSSSDGGVYDPISGVLSFDKLRTNAHNENISLNISSIDFNKMGGVYTPADIKISGELSILSGSLVVNMSDVNTGITVADIPTELRMDNTYTMSDIDIRHFTGNIRYDISNININDIDLSDLPEAITGEGTRINLANPQIYLSLSNPLQPYGLYASTGLKFMSKPRYNGGHTAIGTLPAGTVKVVGAEAGADQNFCLSPAKPDPAYTDYTSGGWIEFDALSNILDCGNSVPASIGIELLDPIVPEQHVSQFSLGTSLGSVDCSYTFIAPLQFNSGTSVAYSDTLDGWSSEDLDCLTIEKLEVNFTIDSSLPVAAVASGYPIDKNGNQISGVTIEEVTIDAMAKGQEVTLKTSGSFSGLDGIFFRVAIKADDADAPAITPDMGLTLTNVRPRVTGYYQKEL